MTVNTDQAIGTVRRAEVPKRPRTAGAFERDLTRLVDYGGDTGVVEEVFGRQTVVRCYAPGATEPMTVTDKAYTHVYAPAGFTLEPGTEAPGPLADADQAASAAMLADAAERARVAAEEETARLSEEAETQRRARERAEQAAKEQETRAAAAEEETARLRAEPDAARAARTDESAKAGKAAKP